MKPYRSKDHIRAKIRGTAKASRGFALVVTLSLMILLTIIAVGLLTLSSISLRSSSQGDAMQTARANARLALMLAIGDLQKQLGPDTRVSATADQTAGSDPSTSSTPNTQKHWTGAYNSWPAALPAASRPTPEFLQWFVSGDPTKINIRNFAATAVSGNAVEIVTKNTVGTNADPVKVPLITHKLSNGANNNFAWWVSDLGTKGLVAEGKELPTAIADIRADQQAAPSSNFKSATAGTVKPFNNLVLPDSRLANVSSWQTSALLADKPENIRCLFHDLTTESRGLLTNVRAGGFRKDLSMELERPVTSAPDPTNTALYKVGGETGINLHELWTYYNLASTTNMTTDKGASCGLQKSGSATFTTEGTMASGTPHLKLLSSPKECQDDNAFYFKQPVIISYQLVLSFQTRLVNNINRLHIVVDPIITFWNPLDVPVVVPTGAFFTVKYWQVPYSIWIKKNGQLQEYPMAGVSRGDGNFLSLQVGNLEPLVFKPGEVIKTSQLKDLHPKAAGEDLHALDGTKGFNFGKGIALEATTRTGAKIDITGNETLVFESARPNELTAGATASDGHTLSGKPEHSRHFSITHHEYYVGKDRDSNSLGIGGMYLDWDFGNRRLKPNEDRGKDLNTDIPGTKPTTDRYYANERNDVFKSFTDGRSIPTSGSKMPFMLLSFNAKTETGSLLGTRSLSRFNPKALHVDFYDLRNPEREMLPYEYTAEILNGWKSNNGSLQQDDKGRGYFGGAMNAEDGTNFVTTHSVPREPIISLAAFQHSFANGFDIQKPKYGYAILNAREPMLPQISHAIGNSLACPVIESSKTEGTLPGGRPMADHSYLANQALWDDWFLSGIAPQTATTFGKSRTQKTVASDFFDEKINTKLPVARFLPNLRGKTPTQLINSFFSGTTPSTAATNEIASYLQVDGLFNVNSTSVEAWKSLLGACKERPVVVRDEYGKESILPADSDTPVSGLLGPLDAIAKGNVALNDPSQWVGRRTLTDSEIDALARAIVKEVRKRGQFLSLADFVNRRVGTDADLARSGAIQSALDSKDVPINSAYNGTRASSGGTTFKFKEAEQGPLSYGIPGIVKQADILTPIAPILSARSDSFLIRGYGERTDASGKVIARAWCEAVVKRSAEFVDPSDLPEKTYSSISTLNKTFGRRFDIVSFRWLNPSEA